VLQCVEVCCSVLQIEAFADSEIQNLQCVAVQRSVLQCVEVCCSVLQIEAFADAEIHNLQCVAVCCSVLAVC